MAARAHDSEGPLPVRGQLEQDEGRLGSSPQNDDNGGVGSSSPLKRTHSGSDRGRPTAAAAVKRRPGVLDPIRRTASTPPPANGGGPKHSPPFKKSTFSGKKLN